jgi:hypothetical protein
MCYGELQTGNLNLCEVPSNLTTPQDTDKKKEKEIIHAFWLNEQNKTKYVQDRKAQIQNELELKAKEEAKKKLKQE